LTVLVALVDGARTVVGADGLTTLPDGGRRIIARHERKWISVGRWAIGLPGWGTPSTLLRRPGSPLDAIRDVDAAVNAPPFDLDAAWYVRDRIGEAVEKLGWHRHPAGGEQEGGPLDWGLSGLLVAPGKLYSLCSDFTVEEVEAGCDARGCGEEFALGALDLALTLGADAESAVRHALETACRLSAGCGGELVVEVLE
jgi:ATP-dependent protease HslVU (ClpYQ) peptidase subunit